MTEQHTQPTDTYFIHPAQLGLRFVLEVIALLAYGVWGWSLASGVAAIFTTLLIPGVVMIAWGLFNVPGDKSRSGTAVVTVPGWVRLVFELAVFGGAGYAMIATGKGGLAAIFLSVTIIHYLTTLSRVKWLLSR